MNQKMEPISFSDDRMFCTVLGNNRELAKKFIETTAGIEIDDIECTQLQKTLNYRVRSKSSNLDVYVKDIHSNMYNLEMENSSKRKKMLMRRARYYASASLLENGKQGMAYSMMKDVYVIFVCQFDPFKEDLARYTTRMVCSETVEETDYGIHLIFLNTLAADSTQEISDELRALLNFIAQKEDARTSLTVALQEEVNRYNKDEEWREWAMTVQDFIDEERQYALEEGRAQGIAEGKAQGIKEGGIKKEKEIIFKLFDDDFEDEKIQRITSCSDDLIKEYRAEWATKRS